jgi:opacity protein-like surface antigen
MHFMKKLLVIAATLAASSAFAGVKLEVRSDYVNTPDYDLNAGGATVNGTSLFTPSVARLYLNGNVGEAVIESAWNLRSFAPESAYNPYTGSYEVFKNVTVDRFVDHLWAGKAMGQWMFKAGKLEVNTGGFERQKSLHGDTYLVSMANSGQGGTMLVAAGTTTTAQGYVQNPENSSGVSAAYGITENHKLEVQVTNQVNSSSITSSGTPPTAANTTRATDRGHTYGLNYLGSFVDKMLVLNVNYTAGTADTAAATGFTGQQLEYISAGLRVAPMADLTIDLEYFGNKNTIHSGATSTDVKTNSTIVEARYNINGWVPVLKYEMSENKASGIATLPMGDFKRDAWALGVEYVPKADEAFRYHIAYSSSKDKDFHNSTAAYNNDVTKNMIVVGFKYTGDMAK